MSDGDPMTERDRDERLLASAGEALSRHRAGRRALETLRRIPGATEQVQGRCSGRSTFLDSRLPAYIVFDFLAAGETIDDFLREYPSADRDQVVALLEAVRDYLHEPLPGAESD